MQFDFVAEHIVIIIIINNNYKILKSIVKFGSIIKSILLLKNLEAEIRNNNVKTICTIFG